MVTKLEAGHWYKEPDGRTWMYIYDYEIPGEESGIRHGVMFRGQRAVTLVRPDYLGDLSTLVEVCYVDGEEMVVGAEYEVSEDKDCWLYRIFAGVLNGYACFGTSSTCFTPWSYWKRVESVTTYHPIKSIDGKEVSRVEVSGEKVKELC